MEEKITTANKKPTINTGGVAKGPNGPKNNGALGIFGPPKPNKNMPTPYPYILI